MRHSGRGLGHMATRYKAGFPAEVFHLDIKDHVAFYKLVVSWGGFTVRKDIKGNFNILHFFCNGIRPTGVTIKLVEVVRLLYSLWEGNAKFLITFQVAGTSFLYLGYNPFTFLKNSAHQLKAGSYSRPCDTTY